MNLILFDDPIIRLDLLPFTFTRPVAAIRTGILTIQEKWEKRLNVKASFKTEEYLQKKFPANAGAKNLLVNGALCPDENLIDAIKALPEGSFLVHNNLLLAANNPSSEMTKGNTVEYKNEFTVIDKSYKIFSENGKQIKADFEILTKGKKSADVGDAHTIVYNKEQIFIEEGASIKAAVLNAETGPIYLSKDSVVQEGSLIRGPFALGEGSHVNMGAKMRGDVSVGPHCKVGGEISATVIFGYSNKAHDGFLGCSVIGEWCNLGADTNNSNLKNNYEEVKLWRHSSGKFEGTGLQFCGLMMGDHSKCGINTMFNTGTVVDVSSNIFGDGFPRNYIPSFAWGGANGFTTYDFKKAMDTAQRVMARRGMEMGETDREIMANVFKMTGVTRYWEKK